MVLETIIIGKQTGHGGEDPYAIIVPNLDEVNKRIGSDYSEQELKTLFGNIIEKVNTESSAFKRIKGFKIQFKEFPKTSTKKIKRYLYKYDSAK